MSKEAALAVATGATPPGSTTPGLTPTSAAPAATPTPEATTVPANLAKKEAEIVRRQQELKKQQAEWAPKFKQAEEILKVGEEFNNLRKTDPVAAMRKLGFTETEIFNFLATPEKPAATPEERAAAAADAAAAARIKAFEDSQAEKAKVQQEQLDQRTLGQFKGTISSLIKTNPEKFEYCAYEGSAAEELIYATVLASVKDSGGKEAMTAQEAAELVESYYEEKDKGMATLKKRTPAPAPVEKKAAERTSKPDPTSPGAGTNRPVITRTRTITNRATATVASTTTKKPETASEKRVRLENILRNGGKA